MALDSTPSPPSSPPTPPSPLPISTGPGEHVYVFSPSPSPSPPLSPRPPSSLSDVVALSRRKPTKAASFSLEYRPAPERSTTARSLGDTLKLLLLRCCCFCCPSLFDTKPPSPKQIRPV